MTRFYLAATGSGTYLVFKMINPSISYTLLTIDNNGGFLVWGGMSPNHYLAGITTVGYLNVLSEGYDYPQQEAI